MSDRQTTISKILKSLEGDRIIDRDIVQEVEQSFLDYSMSVITSRALPDLRDGLKPVHRRIIYSAYQEKLFNNSKFKKSAALVGTVMGSYHPHGDSSIYEALVRMAQDFSLRYPLIEGQGNFGSIDGDSAAAMRYTEARLSKLGEYFLDGIGEECVNFVDNYDQSKKEPAILPTLIPNILINGSTGIAVGLATNIPPHNITEVLNAVLALVRNPDLGVDELLSHIRGPDFPTGGEVFRYEGIRDYFSRGSGTFYLRSKIDLEVTPKRNLLVVKEIPYGIKKSKLIETIVTLIKPPKGQEEMLVPVLADNIVDIRDESSLEGIRLIIECRKEVPARVILNNLYKFTQLQTSYSPNLTVLINGEPKRVSLLTILNLYIEHQLSMLTRRLEFQVMVLSRRLHILEGRMRVSEDILEVVRLINTSDNPEVDLQKRYSLSDEQLSDIFKMTIASLKRIAVDKLRAEFREGTESKISKETILGDRSKLIDTFAASIVELREKFGDDRRTRINESSLEAIGDEELFHFRKIIISLTNRGYLSNIPLDAFKLHRRGGAGTKGAFIHKDDAPRMFLACSGKDDILFFTNLGRVYRMKAYEMNLSLDKSSKGRIAYNLITSLGKEEKIVTIINLGDGDYDRNLYLLFATKLGLVKKCPMGLFRRINVNGKRAITLREGDALQFVIKLTDESRICLASSSGHMVQFRATDCRPLSRSSMGNFGISLRAGQRLVSASSTYEGEYVLSISEFGKGKLTHIDEFKVVKRGKKVGVLSQKINRKTGKTLACILVNMDDEILLMTSGNKINRFRVSDIRVQGRTTSGVKVFNIGGDVSGKGEKLVYFAKNNIGDGDIDDDIFESSHAP